MMSTITSIARVRVLLLAATLCAAQTVSLPPGAGAYPDRESFGSRHPKLKKFGKVAAIGALTGGLSTIFLGGSVVGHAVSGAGTKVGLTYAKDRFKSKKSHSRSR